MTTLSAILFAGRDWVWPALIGLAVLFALIWQAYRRAPADRPVRITAAVFKALGLALLAAFLLEPMWSGMRVRPGANLFLVVTDNSQSLAIIDADNDKSRGDVMRTLVVDNAEDWSPRLAEHFDVRRYLFDTRVRAVDKFDSLTFDGRASRVFGSLADLKQRLGDRPVAGVLLITDGNATDVLPAPQAAALLKSLPPVYPVVIGDAADARDLAVTQLAATQSSFEDAPVSVRCEAEHQGYGGKPVVAQLVDGDGKVVQQQVRDAPTDGSPMAFDFQVKPTGHGVSFYTVRVAAQDELDAVVSATSANTTADNDDTPANKAPSPEATLANNTRQVVVDRGGGPYRILYFSGRPNWEYKFLRRALAKDDQLNLTGLIRIADKQAKFTFRGHKDDGTNPLFQGFDRKDEATERFDEAVFVRLDTADAEELRKGFPSTPQDLFKFHAVILDDIDRDAFTADQLVLLERFVSERGGGLMMLGGTESFEKGAFVHTSVARMLPVYLDRSPDRPTSRVALELTRDGWLQPWVRLRKTEDAERVRLANMPPFVTFNAVRGIKPGAQVLAEVRDEQGTRWPALVAQRFGRGRVAAMTVGDLWRWRLWQLDDDDDTPVAEKDRDQPKAWRQAVRWLVADVPARVDVDARRRTDHPDAPFDLSVRVRDKTFVTMDNAKVTIQVKTPDGKTVSIDADATADESGHYRATYLPRVAGAYRATITVDDASGQRVGETETGWTADPAGDEFRSVQPNHALLDTIAQQTGGEVVLANDLADLVTDLPTRQAEHMEQSITPLWHTWWMLAAALACLVGEWGLRRWRGLP